MVTWAKYPKCLCVDDNCLPTYLPTPIYIQPESADAKCELHWGHHRQDRRNDVFDPEKRNQPASSFLSFREHNLVRVLNREYVETRTYTYGTSGQCHGRSFSQTDALHAYRIIFHILKCTVCKVEHISKFTKGSIGRGARFHPHAREMTMGDDDCDPVVAANQAHTYSRHNVY
jgi:hypothetical protein